MRLTLLKPSKSLNKAYYKESVKRNDIESLKAGLKLLYSRIDEKESEEHLKNIISDFLKTAIYQNKFEINTRNRIDLAIHNGKTSKESVGVIIETKKPQSPERITKENFNNKALHELILYYFDERNEQSNIQVKHLVTTNIFEWFIFDENEFDKLFYRNVKFHKLYKSKIEQGKDNPFFYTEAQKIVAEIEDEILCTYFNLNDFRKENLNTDITDDDRLIDLYKILSPEHLLKLPFVNDSNSLNKEFYNELLHIIGLEEYKEGSKKLINRKKEESRDDGSLLENTINELRTDGCIDKIKNPEQYGESEETRLFSIALELCINWLNRILFLKLLEGQLIKYNKGERSYAFLNSSNIKDFDELNELFFEVLAVKTSERTKSVNEKFGNIPYLNSSLFERNDLENQTIRINSLKDRLELPLYKSTILKDSEGKRICGKKLTLHYLFDFLDAYDFASESSAKIQEQNKSIINASVLGLIFEKINGYKDGSFFTPGFITMYMSRETIRKSVIQKFNEKFGWNIKEFSELKDKIDCTDKSVRLKSNEIINSLKICDPAVGSGHFLVSALNELITIKSDLGILQMNDGARIRGYKISIENDELIIIDEETDRIFEYSLNQNKKPVTELQTLQEALFHEKQNIIENCLFGVDINPKSVMICRLRLWIELLKNSYYTKESNYVELETLPNIDINIKCGNSLISRFSLDADLSKALKSIKYDIKAYRGFVNDYKNAHDKQEKKGLEKIIDSIKSDFRSEIYNNDPKVIRLNKLGGELYSLLNQKQIFELSAKEKTNRKQQQEKLELEINKLTAQIEEIKSSAIYRNAFEWRFEFPEVLDEKGDFVGFDVVIGNPPYLSSKDFNKNLINYLNINYITSQYQLDLYISFIEKAINLVTKQYYISFITPNSWLKNLMFSNCRDYLLKTVSFKTIFPNLANVFIEASVDTLIFIAKKTVSDSIIKISKFNNQNPIIDHLVDQKRFEKNDKYIFDVETNNEFYSIIQKVRQKSNILQDVAEITRGVNPYDKYRGQDEEIIKNKAYHSSTKKDQTFVPEIRGKHVNCYSYSWDGKHYISYGDWLAAPREKKFFQGPRIIMRQVLGEKLNCTIINEDFIIDQSIFIAKPYKDNEKFIDGIQGVLASKLISEFFKYTSNEFDLLFPKIKIGEFKNLPIPKELDKVQVKIGEKVQEIIKLKVSNPNLNTSALEKQIDQLVYKIYDLTDEEIAIIENSEIKKLIK